MELKGKTAVITGAASGIGLATCEAMAREGVSGIAMVDRSAAVNDAAQKLNADAGREVAFAFVGDVTSQEFRRGVFSTMHSKFGTVHLCVPAAGITRDRLSLKINKDTGKADVYPLEDMRTLLDINLIAPIYWAIECVASIAEERVRKGLGRWDPAEGAQGCVVMIGSVSSTGNKGQISYATAKAGLEGAQATLAKEAIFFGTRCAIIHPGYTDTPMVRSLGEEFIKDQILPHTQLRRLCRPAEIADAIVFMMKNSAVSGSLWVDAGWHPAA
ncbi:MAG: SDR family oxidoreductase [Planctomycetes bacterium]|nr:SDR family oxidoreductase [Planctomycetota bacterium]